VSDDTTPIYFRVSPAIWRARTWTDDMRLLACYLLTSPHRTLEGLFILPKGYCCADLKWSPERLAEPFAGLIADGFIAYDEAAEVCLIVKAMKYQRPENPNMDKAAIRRLVTVRASSLDRLFHALAQQYAPRLAERLAERLPGTVRQKGRVSAAEVSRGRPPNRRRCSWQRRAPHRRASEGRRGSRRPSTRRPRRLP
jgi:hypothetical protein